MTRTLLRPILTIATLMTSPALAWAGACSADQDKVLLRAQVEIASIAETALGSVPSSASGIDPRYTKCFGQYTKARADKVRSTLSQVISVTSVGTITYECEPHTQTNCSNLSTWAFVFGNDEYRVRICDRFFAGDKKFRSPLLLHELTHFKSVGATDDHCKKVSACETLANNDADKAVESAMNFQIFTFLHRSTLNDLTDFLLP